MKLIDLILLAVVAVIVALAVWYIRIQKKNGAKCIGCPDSKTCSGNCCGGCSSKCNGCSNNY